MQNLQKKYCQWTTLESAWLTVNNINLLTTDGGKQKVQCLLKDAQHGAEQGEQATHAQKTWTPRAFGGRVFKGKEKERVAGYLISLCIFFWVVGGKVTGWYFGSLSHQCSGSKWFEIYILVVSMQLTSSVCRQLKDIVQDSSTTLEEETMSLDFVLWLAIIILSCLTVFLCFLIFLFLRFNLLLGTQEEPRKLKLFYEQEEGHRELCPTVFQYESTLLFYRCCCEMNYAGLLQWPRCSFFCKKSHTRGIYWVCCFLSPITLIPKRYKCASPGQLVLLPQPLQELSRGNLKLAPVLGEGDQEKAVGTCVSHSAMSESLQPHGLGSSVHGILHVRILEWVLIPFSGDIVPTQGSNPDILHCRQIVY